MSRSDLRVVRFEVAGDPVPQGSMRAFARRGRAVVTHSAPARLADWRQAIGWAAREAQRGPGLLAGAVAVRATFRLQRPGSVPPRKRPHPSVRPDLDKLARSLLDALSGVVIGDDAQVCRLEVVKVYCTPGEAPGASVEVRELRAGANTQLPATEVA